MLNDYRRRRASRAQIVSVKNKTALYVSGAVVFVLRLFVYGVAVADAVALAVADALALAERCGLCLPFCQPRYFPGGVGLVLICGFTVADARGEAVAFEVAVSRPNCEFCRPCELILLMPGYCSDRTQGRHDRYSALGP